MTETKKRGARCQCCAHPRVDDLNRDLVRGSVSDAVARKVRLDPTPCTGTRTTI